MKNTTIAIKFITLITILTGFLYPVIVTALSQLFFNHNANGKIIFDKKSKCIGSELIGQDFKDKKYFQGRASAIGYNPIPSGGSNQSLTNKNLISRISEKSKEGQNANLIYTSASGLDPHISPEAALDQVPKIAKERNLNETEINRLKKLVQDSIEHRQFKILGEERINVLLLNLKLDDEFSNQGEK